MVHLRCRAVLETHPLGHADGSPVELTSIPAPVGTQLERPHLQVARPLGMSLPPRSGRVIRVDDDLALFQTMGFTVDLVAVPTTVFYGAEDVMVPAHGAWRAVHIPAAWAVVDSAGHLPDPDKLEKRLSQLIRQDQNPH
jgi:pimeloyl-ACP methyl ester carboxylesterase